MSKLVFCSKYLKSNNAFLTAHTRARDRSHTRLTLKRILFLQWLNRKCNTIYDVPKTTKMRRKRL